MESIIYLSNNHSLAFKKIRVNLPMVGPTEDVGVTGGAAVVMPGGNASEGCNLQFAAPTVKLMSSSAMSPV